MGEHKHPSSFRDQLIEAARKAAIEATTNERARCLWCAEEVVRELGEKLGKKFLLSAAHEQAAKVKLQIARAVVVEMRRAIISGVRPGHVTGQKPDAADFSSAPHECAICGDVMDLDAISDHNCGGVGLRDE